MINRFIECFISSLYYGAMKHLHTRSCWTLLESPFRIDEIIQTAIDHKASYAVLTDKNTMYGTMEFLTACKKNNLKPIVGLEVDAMGKEGTFNLLLLAKNAQGLKNLYSISSKDTSSQDPLSIEEVAEYSQDCIVLSGGEEDALTQLASHGNLDGLAMVLCQFQKLFSQYYVSIALNDSSRRRSENITLKSVAHSMGIGTVALSRIDYREEKDVSKVRMLKAIEYQTLYRCGTLGARSGRYYRSQEEMKQLYDQDDLDMTETIASQIDLQLPEKASLPHFENKLGITSNEYLIKLCKAGLKKRLNNQQPAAYLERLNYELSVIEKMDLADYFLIVWDFIRFARKEGILVGPGRGSAAGSLVSYCLGISHIDPLRAGLLFERFLNPSRITMPDIDTDFPDNRRDEVVQYLKDRYGFEHTGHIVVFSTLKAKMVLKDVARAMAIHVREVEQLTKLIPSVGQMTLLEAYETIPAFKRKVDHTSQMKELFVRASELEGLPRHASIHPGGIILAKDAIQNQAPCFISEDGLQCVQFTKEEIEPLGLIKIDLLGLRNLTYIQNILDSIATRTGVEIDPFHIPLDDPQVYALLKRADTLGVFQLESDGIRNLLRRFQPERFEDIAAILALYRPGPMKEINTYLQARQSRQKNSLHPLLDSILAESGGIFLYQEQIMKAAEIVGGFTLAQADTLRKAMSKKDRQSMESWKQKFIQGAKEKGIDEKQSSYIFEMMERFADYGFNKSHSYAYGLVVYWMAWLKTRYPYDFYKVLLESNQVGSSKMLSFIREVRLKGMQLLGVDINQSQEGYSIESQGLRMGLTSIKGLNRRNIQFILETRKKRGSFSDFVDACLWLYKSAENTSALNEKQLETLIWSGAFDGFCIGRQSLHNALETVLKYINVVRVPGEATLIQEGIISKPVILEGLEDPLKNLEKEKETLGFYLKDHPASALRKQYPKAIPIGQMIERMGKRLETTGRVVSIKTHMTKNGQEMAFVGIEDETGTMDLSVMPDLWAHERDNLEKNKIIHVVGNKNRERSLLPDVIHYGV